MSTVIVAGRPTAAWCGAEGLAALGDAWELNDDGDLVCSAPGVYVVDGATRFVLPRCYGSVAVLEGNIALRAALVLLRALSRYRLRSNQRAVSGMTGATALREVGAIDDALGWLEVALLLSEDAVRNGPLYVATSRVSPRREGRIHWPRTQQRGFHVVDGAEIMTSPLWRSRHGIDPEDALTRLHVDTCTSISATLGIGVAGVRRWTNAEALSVLDRREYALYADRHRVVARWLRQYWAGAMGAVGARRAGVAALWAPAFPLVWEAMLREVMGGRAFAMPPGTYRLTSGTSAGLRLVPDFVIDREGTRLVVDAKHYALDSLPGTESLAKQLLYRWFASRESGHGDVALADVVSVFVLPAVRRAVVADMLGAHDLDGEESGPRAFGRVWVLAVDFEVVAEAYSAGRRIPGLLEAVRADWPLVRAL